MPKNNSTHSSYICSFWKPVHIPSARPLRIFYHELETFKIERCHRIKTDIKQDKGPFKECINGVCWKQSTKIRGLLGVRKRTPCYFVDLMLDEKVNQRYKCTKKA